MRYSLICSTAALILASTPLFAADNAAQEAATAHAHAKMAAGADSIDMTHTHLHHVINCLVGPDGDAFDADAGNPCDGMGDGALNDADSDSDLHDQLQKALETAQKGLDQDDLDAAHETANNVADLLPEGSDDQ